MSVFLHHQSFRLIQEILVHWWQNGTKWQPIGLKGEKWATGIGEKNGLLLRTLHARSSRLASVGRRDRLLVQSWTWKIQKLRIKIISGKRIKKKKKKIIICRVFKIFYFDLREMLGSWEAREIGRFFSWHFIRNKKRIERLDFGLNEKLEMKYNKDFVRI